MSAETMKIPDPIMLPIIMVVASKSFRPRANCPPPLEAGTISGLSPMSIHSYVTNNS